MHLTEFINAINQWVARYKKDGIKSLNEKPHTGRNGLFVNQSLATIFNSVIALNKDKKGGRIRLIDIDQLLKSKFDIHYKNLNGVHYLMNRLGIINSAVKYMHATLCENQQGDMPPCQKKRCLLLLV